MDVLCIQLAIMLVFAVVCGAIAASRGRNPVGWAVVGFIAPIIGLILVCVLPNLKEQQNREAYIAEQNRRLREQLRQEQLKAEALRQHALARLDAHDEHLGIDTRQLGQSLPAPQAAGQLTAGDPVASLEASNGSPDNRPMWYYDNGLGTQGPFSAMEISQLLQSGQLTGATLVWAEHLVDWQPLRAVAQFQNDVV